jgi:hypothetical protein
MRGWARGSAVLVAALVMTLGAVTSARAAATFACVASNLNTCTVKIPLTSNMDEQITATMPDSHPWFLNELDGVGPWGLTGPGNTSTSWNGNPNALSGTVFSGILTTGADEPSGSYALLTFAHVTSISAPTPVHYKSVTVTAPSTGRAGSTITIVGVVKPVPAKGHLLLQHKSGSKWTTVATLAYSSHAKHWATSLKWRYPTHAVESFRLLASAATGLLATASRTFKISTVT